LGNIQDYENNSIAFPTLPDGQWRDPDRIKTFMPAPFTKAECLYIQESDKHPPVLLTQRR